MEITFERAGEPLRVERYLGDLDFDYVSTHALKLSVGSPDPLIRAISTPCRKLLRRTGEIQSVIIKGSRAMELEGPRWGTSRPAGFMPWSRSPFDLAQMVDVLTWCSFSRPKVAWACSRQSITRISCVASRYDVFLFFRRVWRASGLVSWLRRRHRRFYHRSVAVCSG